MTQHTKCTQQGVILNKKRSSLKFVKIVERITVDPRNNGKFGHPYIRYFRVFRYITDSPSQIKKRGWQNLRNTALLQVFTQ